jgi:hypothetical protein
LLTDVGGGGSGGRYVPVGDTAADPLRWPLIETPPGMLPIDLIMQLARGPDLLGVVILMRPILR